MTAHPLAPHPDIAALVLLVLVLVAMLVIGFLWFREDEPQESAIHLGGRSRELRQLAALGQSEWWQDFERQFAAYVASRESRKPDGRR